MYGRFFDGDMKTAQKTIIFINKFFQNLLLPRVLTLVVFSVIIVILLIQHYFQLPADQALVCSMAIHDGSLFINTADFHTAHIL